MNHALERKANNRTRQRPCVSAVVVSLCVSRRPTFSRTIPIRTIIREDQRDHSATACARKAHQVAETIRTLSPSEWFADGLESFDPDLCDIVENLEGMSPFTYPGECIDLPIDEFNQLIARLLDWAEDANVCLGV